MEKGRNSSISREDMHRLVDQLFEDTCTCFWCYERFPYPKRGNEQEKAEALVRHFVKCDKHPLKLGHGHEDLFAAGLLHAREIVLHSSSADVAEAEINAVLAVRGTQITASTAPVAAQGQTPEPKSEELGFAPGQAHAVHKAPVGVLDWWVSPFKISGGEVRFYFNGTLNDRVALWAVSDGAGSKMTTLQLAFEDIDRLIELLRKYREVQR